MHNMKSTTACLLLSTGGSVAISLNTDSTTSITSAAETIAGNVMSMYNGTAPGNAPGLFPSPYYWYESGLAWDVMVNYWAQTGDDTYNNIVNQALSFQVGPNRDYMPPNQTKSEGNDDQTSWALAAMTAAEQGFPAPVGQVVNATWAQLAETVFNDQVARWDDGTCGGGLRWQIFTFNAGYDYKNSFSNGNFYQLASRLALYTGNSTYRDWAERALLWTTDLGLFDRSTGNIYDGASTITNCSTLNHLQWTSNSGTYLSGAVYLYNYSSTSGNSFTPFRIFVGMNDTFTQNRILAEVACETNNNCNTDQLAFKAIGSRALARARDMVHGPIVSINGTDVGTFPKVINAVIVASAQGAAAQCSGGATGSVCGTNWRNATWDGTSGLGQQLSALEIVLALLPGKKLRNVNSTSTATATATSGSSAGSGTTTVTAIASGSSYGGGSGYYTPANASASSNASSAASPTTSVVVSTGIANRLSGSLMSLLTVVGIVSVGLVL